MKSTDKALITATVNADKIASDEFTRILKESKALERKKKKEYVKIANKNIMKQRLVQLYVSGYYSLNQIASMLMVSRATINKLLKEPEIIEMVIAYQDEEKQMIDTRLKALRLKATETISDLMESDDDNIRLSVAKDVLDRTGFKAKDKVEMDVNISYEQQLQQLIEGVEYTEYQEVNE